MWRRLVVFLGYVDRLLYEFAERLSLHGKLRR